MIKTKDLKYQEYLKLQKEKTTDPSRREKWISAMYENAFKFQDTFQVYMGLLSEHLEEPVYCLGARTGEEALALRLLGFSNCYGTDLVPHAEHVIEDDIHDMQFDDATVGLFYSNIFDHSIDPVKFLSEIARCLRPGGHAFLQLQLGRELDHYGVLEIEDAEDFHSLLKEDHLKGRLEVVVTERNAVLTPHNHSLNWNIILRKVGIVSE